MNLKCARKKGSTKHSHLLVIEVCIDGFAEFYVLSQPFFFESVFRET